MKLHAALKCDHVALQGVGDSQNNLIGNLYEFSVVYMKATGELSKTIYAEIVSSVLDIAFDIASSPVLTRRYYIILHLD